MSVSPSGGKNHVVVESVKVQFFLQFIKILSHYGYCICGCLVNDDSKAAKSSKFNGWWSFSLVGVEESLLAELNINSYIHLELHQALTEVRCY